MRRAVIKSGLERFRSSSAKRDFHLIATVGNPIDRRINAHPNFVGSIRANSSSTESPQKIQTPNVIATEKANRLHIDLRKIDLVEGVLVTEFQRFYGNRLSYGVTLTL